MFEPKPPEEHLMRYDPDKPGLFALLRGEGDDPLMRFIAWAGALVLPFLFAVCLFNAILG